MALMNEPKVLLLDEPTAGINPTLINGLIDRLKRANEEFGITLFVIEHNMRVIMNLARSEEHTSELQSLMRISYAVFCLQKKKTTNHITISHNLHHNQHTILS